MGYPGWLAGRKDTNTSEEVDCSAKLASLIRREEDLEFLLRSCLMQETWLCGWGQDWGLSIVCERQLRSIEKVLFGEILRGTRGEGDDIRMDI